MDQWEYTVEHFVRDNIARLEAVLNELGNVGWELCGIFDDGGLFMILKRKKILKVGD